MAIQVINANFTSGELSPLLYARIDFDGYYKGAKKLKNVLVIPQGGATRRFGTRVVQDNLPVSDYTKIRMEVLEFNEIYYLFLFRHLKIDVYENDIFQGTLDSPYTDSQVNELSFSQQDAKLLITHQEFLIRALQPAAVPEKYILIQEKIRNFPTYDFRRDYDDVTFKPSATTATKATPLTLTATAGGTPFVIDHINGLFFGNEGTLRITEFTSSTVVKGYTIEDFKNTDDIEGQDAYLAEPAFGNTRKWPRRVAFYQGRMALGGTIDLPGFMGLSATNDFFNFDDSTDEDSDPIIALITASDSSTIRFIQHGVDLFVFTDSGEFTTPPFSDKPATPSTTYFTQQTTNGIANIRPVLLDNKIIFVDKGGKIIREMFYDVQKSSYQAVNISILSAHLINNPISVATFENPSLNDGVYMIVVNEDGTLAIYQSIDVQNIKAWMPSDTDGKFRQVVSKNDQVYFLVERTINESSTPETRLYLEKVDFSIFTDVTKSFTFGSPQLVISSLEWLNEKYVWVTADGSFVGRTLVHNNTITLDVPATTVTIGLGSTIEVIPMAVNTQGRDGPTRYKNKRIKRIYLDFLDSLGIKVNGNIVPSLKLGEDEIGSSPTPKSGIVEIDNMGGWNKDEEVVITQDEPLPFTIRSISYEVEV